MGLESVVSFYLLFSKFRFELDYNDAKNSYKTHFFMHEHGFDMIFQISHYHLDHLSIPFM